MAADMEEVAKLLAQPLLLQGPLQVAGADAALKQAGGGAPAPVVCRSVQVGCRHATAP